MKYLCTLLTLTASAITIGAAAAQQEGGTQDRVDVSKEWRFATDPEDVGTGERWHEPGFDDSSWARLDAGQPWTQQGYADYTGLAWYRKNVRVPAAWQGGKVWLVLGGVSNTMDLYVNGRLIAPYGNYGRSAKGPCLAELGACLNADADNVLALRIDGGGQRAGLYKGACFLTADPAAVPRIVEPACFVSYADRVATVRAAMRGLGRGAFQGTVAVALLSPDRSRTLARTSFPIPQYFMDALGTLTLPAADEARTYPVELAFLDETGNPIPGTRAGTEARWPGKPAIPPAYGELRVLNNLVTELASVTCGPETPVRVRFTNPREGWVFFRLQGAHLQDPKVVLDDEETPLRLREYPFTGALEAMRFLPEGQHDVTLAGAADAALTIRAIPEIGYYAYPTAPALPVYGSGDGSRYSDHFMQRYILPNVTTLMSPEVDDEAFLRQWLQEGRRWVGTSHLLGLGDAPPVAGRKCYEQWCKSLGVTQPEYGGLIVDEFQHLSKEHFAEWLEALRLLDADARFAGKTFYAYCGLMSEHEPSRAVQRYLVDQGHRFAYEQYLVGTRSLEQHRCYIGRRYVEELRDWKAVEPRILDHLVVCPTFTSMPPCTFDTEPRINLNVSIDMQFRTLATEPDLWGVAGVMQWTANYTDTETLRLAYRIMRHYCIEGETTPYLADPLEPDHVHNPDFEFGLAHWTAEEAAPGSVTTGHVDGYSLVHGRYWRTYKGDRFAVLKRVSGGTNRLSQELRGLEPGRLYSVKLHTTDRVNLTAKQEHAVRLEIDGAEILRDLSFQTVCQSSLYRKSGELEDLPAAYGNFLRTVFRPEGSTARLVISDDTGAGSPNQELTCSFVAVRPYYPAD